MQTFSAPSANFLGIIGASAMPLHLNVANAQVRTLNLSARALHLNVSTVLGHMNQIHTNAKKQLI